MKLRRQGLPLQVCRGHLALVRASVVAVVAPRVGGSPRAAGAADPPPPCSLAVPRHPCAITRSRAVVAVRMRKWGHSVGPERLEEMRFFTDDFTKLAGTLLVCGEEAGELPHARSIGVFGYRSCGRSRCRERTSREYADGDCSDCHWTPSLVD